VLFVCGDATFKLEAFVDFVLFGQAALGSSGLVLISDVPHCTQVWVTSSRSFAAPSSYSAGATEVIAIRLPQCWQGRRKLGRSDGETSL
jgi:hypothetical protein